MSGCEVIALLEGAAPSLSTSDLCVAIYHKIGKIGLDATWRDGRWLWILRDGTPKQIKSFGYCDTAAQALQLAAAEALK